jgi:hypothetical protein
MKLIDLYHIRWSRVGLVPTAPNGTVYDLYTMTDGCYMHFRGVPWQVGRNHI